MLRNKRITIIVALLVIGLCGFFVILNGSSWFDAAPSATESLEGLQLDDDGDDISANEMQGAESEDAEEEPELTLAELVAAYGDIPLIDAHNHNASSSLYIRMLPSWELNRVDKVVLFGDVSEPSAKFTDKVSWEAYLEYPDQFIPFFSGINLLEEEGLETVRGNFEKGYFGIGEIAAASTYSHALANVIWKTQHPMDGILPQIYEICAEYQAPILMHIDPTTGMVIDELEKALIAYPDTKFIFAHMNVYNTPENMERLLEKYPNLYADFFAGFTAFNPDSPFTLEDFVPLIQKFPDQFMLSTDSGFGLISEEVAIEAMYRMMDALDDRELARKIAYDNLYGLIENQPATKTQLEAIVELDRQQGIERDLTHLTKLEAGKILRLKDD